MAASRLVNRNITAATGRTSMRLEPEIWEALREICLRENQDLRDVIRAVEGEAGIGGRTSAVRVHVLQYFRAAATPDGHSRAGHGASANDVLAAALDDGADAIRIPAHEMPPLVPAEEMRALEA